MIEWAFFVIFWIAFLIILSILWMYIRLKKYKYYIKTVGVLVDLKEQYLRGKYFYTPIYEFIVGNKKYQCVSLIVRYSTIYKKNKIIGRISNVYYLPDDPTINVHRIDRFDFFHSDFFVTFIILLIVSIICFFVYIF